MNSHRIPSPWLICLLIGLPQISETIYTPSLPSIAESLLCGVHQTEWTLSIYFIGFALGVGLWGRLADRYGRRPMMLLGLIIYCLVDLACIYVGSIYQLLTLRFIQAFGASVGSVVTQTMMRDAYHGPARGKLFALVGMSLSFSPALGPMIGGFLDASFGWRANFVGLALLGGSLLLLSFWQLPETLNESAKASPTSTLSVAKRLLQDKFVIQCMVLVGIINGVLFSYYSEAPFIFIDMLNFSAKQYGLTGIVIGLAGFLGAMAARRLLSFYSEQQLILLGAVLTLIGAGWIWSAFKLLSVQASQVILASHLLGGMFMMVFGGMAVAIPNILSIALKSYSDCLGTAGSLFGLSYYILVAFFTFIMGVIHNGTLLAMPSYFLVLAILFVLVAVQLLKSTQTVAVQTA